MTRNLRGCTSLGNWQTCLSLQMLLTDSRRQTKLRCMPCHIYALCDPRLGVGYIYVGQTIEPVHARMYRHMADAVRRMECRERRMTRHKGTKLHKAGLKPVPTVSRWLYDLHESGLLPIVCTIQTIFEPYDDGVEDAVERHWIRTVARCAGKQCLNTYCRGSGNRKGNRAKRLYYNPNRVESLEPPFPIIESITV